MLIDDLGQLSQGFDGDHWRVLVTDGLAPRRVEHPTGHGELQPVLQPDDETRLHLAAKGADDLYFLVEERVVPVTDACEPEFMSSVETRCEVCGTRHACGCPLSGWLS